MTEPQVTSNKYQVLRDEHKHITIESSGEYIVELIGPGAEVTIFGAFETMGSDKAEISVTIHHKAPHTRANTTLKGVGRDKSSIRFVGRIIIDKDCPDINSFLEERILLLSPQARAEAIPELEIESNDVKCSHAATVSQIPAEHLFYLMSRGVPKLEAEAMIVEGFLQK